MSDITLSLCLSGRNDDYGVDFKRRFVQAMNFLAWSASRAGVLDRLEVVFVDWNSEIPLASVLKLSEEAAPMVRFIEVPPTTATPLNFGKTPFHTVRSLNVAYRRARGKFIGMMPADILLTRFALARLFELLEKKWEAPFDVERATLGIPRSFLPNYGNDAAYFSSPEEIERILCAADWYLPRDSFEKGLLGGMGCFIFFSALLRSLRGSDEQIGGWGGSDIETGLRAAQHGSELVNLAACGVTSYDFDVNPAMVRQKLERMAAFPLRKQVNDDDWGMARESFPERFAAVGVMPKESAGVPENPEQELLFRLRFLPLECCTYISARAMAAGIAVLKRQPRNICVCEAEAATVAMTALAAPYAALTVVSESREELEKIAAVLAAMHHPAPVTMRLTPPCSGTFDFVISPDSQFPDEIRNCGGNLFSRLRLPKRFGKLWNIIGRVPLSRWFEIRKILKNKR